MAFYKIWASRVNASVEDYVGEEGRLFYDDTDGIIRIGDGQTQGGLEFIISNSDTTIIGGGEGVGNLVVNEFPLNGTQVTVNFSTFNIINIIAFEILDDNREKVEVVHKMYSNRLVLDSNIDLVDHVLRMTYLAEATE